MPVKMGSVDKSTETQGLISFKIYGNMEIAYRSFCHGDPKAWNTGGFCKNGRLQTGIYWIYGYVSLLRVRNADSPCIYAV